MISWTEREGIDAKQAWHRAYAGFKRYAESKGFKNGWVAYTFREFSGRWPNGEAVEDAAPADATLRWLLKQRGREYAKQRKEKESAGMAGTIGGIYIGDAANNALRVLEDSALMTEEDWGVKL